MVVCTSEDDFGKRARISRARPEVVVWVVCFREVRQNVERRGSRSVKKRVTKLPFFKTIKSSSLASTCNCVARRESDGECAFATRSFSSFHLIHVYLII